ncbi:CBS domain-containing protein [Kribbella sp. NBC_01245]|uniref:CBS domain-containing protein n=1 Tax=Kribbella sp. NBC_01245 TaxID=2903578 RepID=UPI002E2A11F4|nr:CBS domain-containing protein [Kribbella sp. NBC_01245]
MKINDVLRGKGNEVVTISPEATVSELLALLAEHNVGALVVSADGRSVDGIVSERDIVRLIHRDPDGLRAQVATIMTAEVHTCDPDTHIDDLMRLMTDRRIRHVPVVIDGSLSGIVSIGDVVKTRIGELEFEREQLSKYIASAG